MVRCGETATFSVRDGTMEGLTCSAGGESSMTDVTGRYTFQCAPSNGDSPCATCASAVKTGDCVWRWAAPSRVADALEVS